MRRSLARVVVLLALPFPIGFPCPAGAAPDGTMTWGVHITLASR
jgi:hypothetical protein